MNEQNENTALAVVSQIPPTDSAVAQWRRTTDIAGLVRAVVLNCTVEIQKRKYLTVAGYQAVANAFGCVASARDVVRVEGGWQAVGEVKRMSDGMVLSTGVGFLGDDEPMWKTRPQFSKMAMAQTRACGRALRAAFAFMAPVIDGNLQTTPAEEMDFANGGTTEPPPPAPVRGNAAVKAALRPSPPKAIAPNEPPPHEDADFRPDGAPSRPAHVPTSPPTHDRTLSFKFGKSKGVPLADLDEGSLKFYEGCLKRDLADASKSQYHANATQQLANLQAEFRYRGL